MQSSEAAASSVMVQVQLSPPLHTPGCPGSPSGFSGAEALQLRLTSNVHHTNQYIRKTAQMRFALDDFVLRNVVWLQRLRFAESDRCAVTGVCPELEGVVYYTLVRYVAKPTHAQLNYAHY